MTSPLSPAWQNLAAQKKIAQANTIPDEWILGTALLPPDTTLNVVEVPESCGLLTPKEIQITTAEISVLLANLADATWSAVEVTTAFAKRAVIAHQLVNCLTEIFIDRALERAARLDEVLKTTGKVVGPLHGLPISLKDQINVQGLDSTMGYVSWIGRPAQNNAVLVDILEAAGAVMYVKTNVPQTLMWPETYNHVFGRTTNPYNRKLTSGGSSGGEGALVALKGSPIGVGSDIGGSVRIPAAFCGTYGLRPSYGRIPYAGCVNSMEGQDSLPSVLGPLCNSLDAVKLFMKSVAGLKPWILDPLAVRKPWNEEEYLLVDHGGPNAKLCFGILWDDEHVRPHPPVLRGLEETKKALLAAGHSVIDWKPYKHMEIVRVSNAIFAAGAAEDYRVSTSPSGEPVIQSMLTGGEGYDYIPKIAPGFRPVSGGTSSYDLWQIQKRRRDLRQEYLNYWNATVTSTGTGRPVDAIISPCAPYVAPPHGLNSLATYTTIWNGLDYTALVIPTGFSVDPVSDAPVARDQFYSDDDRAIHTLYNPQTFQDAPISIQVVGRTLEEEAVIAIGEIVDAAPSKISSKSKM